MLTETLRRLFSRDLLRLQEEVTLYQNEQNLWLIDKAIANSAGNLCLHLIGNLKTYIGAELGGAAYVRQRSQEFSARYVPRAELLAQLAETRLLVDQSLGRLSEADVQQIYPQVVFDAPMTTEYFLVHLATHLAYHLGQVNYHRRLLDA
ncbi:DinB family protein [Hymenobacter lutimineralis]|uniref:DinB family protein n=1 Tax=Hymenobacter lutimineralis TaxID=2606448 RepID=A0A5D6UWJ0_9BACT|nr:DinB family protein [Hymenobacter lutimineralis]TYZ08121.1 DinB family protein [Hymenobacter lutimineralis]